MEFEKCKDILLRETGLVRRIALIQEQIREAVINRNWADFESRFSVLGEIGNEFAVLENERDELFSQGEVSGREDDNDGKGKFYFFAARFPEERRNELTSVYRTLKLETLRVQSAGEDLMGFIAGARAALAGFFEIAFPDRGGKIYTQCGRPITHDMRSMVLNRTF